MAGLVDVVSNIIEVWPLVVSFLTETGGKDDGDSPVLRLSALNISGYGFTVPLLQFCCLEEKVGEDRYMYLDQLTRMKFRLFHLLLDICKCSRHVVVKDCIGYVVVLDRFVKITRNALAWFLIGSTFAFICVSRISFNFLCQRRWLHVCDICCCFSCQQFCSVPICSRLRVSRFRIIGPINLLPAAENTERFLFAACGGMGGVYHTERLPISCRRGGGFSSRHT